MKILVIQLARFGDIYQTWPALKGLRRKNPNAEIHVLVRSRFKEAMNGMTAVNFVTCLPTDELLRDIIDPKGDVCDSIQAGQNFLQSLSQQNFDAVYNLSYSRTGAFLVNFLACSENGKVPPRPLEISGYSLHSDGVMFPVDSTSSYFMAQVGVGKYNRFHLMDIFANQMGVELEDSDLNFKNELAFERSDILEVPQVVIHIGASDNRKTLEPTKWVGIIKGLIDSGLRNVCIVGAKAEFAVAQQIENSISGDFLINYVGRTSLIDMFSILKKASLFIGGDSSILQVASLVGCKSLNLSTGSVSFWETGPRASDSKIYYCDDFSLLNVQEVSRVASFMLGQTLNGNFSESLIGKQITENDEFLWNFIQALYLGADFPILQSILDYESLQHFNELNELSLVNLSGLLHLERIDSKNKNAEVLMRVDQAFVKLAALSPPASILWDWLQVERIKIPPLELAKVVQETIALHQKLRGILNLYSMKSESEAMRG